MSTATAEPIVIFPDWHDTRAELEATARGYLSHVVVQLQDGSRYQLLFYDPVRLEQDLTTEARGFLAEPNMVVVSDVTSEKIKDAVRGLWQQRYFEFLKPL